MDKNIRSVLYAGGLQFCFPGLGRIYLGNWGIGILQLLTSIIGLGFIWSFIDGYLMIVNQFKVERSKLKLVYYDVKPNEELLLNSDSLITPKIKEKSPLSAAVSQLFVFGFGRLYLGNLMLGIFQIMGIALIYGMGYISSQSLVAVQFYHSYCSSEYYNNFCCNTSVPNMLGVCIVTLIIRFLIVGWMIFDSYCILKGNQINSDKKPLNYSVAVSFQKINIGSKDKFIAGILQLCIPGLGRCYMGFWIPGLIQFLLSFVTIGSIWSWVDGHHILLNSDVDKDGQGNPLIDQYRLN